MWMYMCHIGCICALPCGGAFIIMAHSSLCSSYSFCICWQLLTLPFFSFSIAWLPCLYFSPGYWPIIVSLNQFVTIFCTIQENISTSYVLSAISFSTPTVFKELFWRFTHSHDKFMVGRKSELYLWVSFQSSMYSFINTKAQCEHINLCELEAWISWVQEESEL